MVNRRETLKVEEGQILSLEFTAFDVHRSSNCAEGYLMIMDGDTTTLMERSCGSSGNLVIGNSTLPFKLPPIIRSRSNTVHLVFVTGARVRERSGWRVNWSAGAAAGESLP